MNKNKIIYILIGIIVILVISNILLLINYNGNKDTVDYRYSDVIKKIENKEEFLLYYYNSKGTSSFNLEIKKYLDKEKIKYYYIDELDINKEEYNKLLELLNIDGDVYSIPALIYIRDGMNYGDLINIDNIDLVHDYLMLYDLYRLK